MTDRRYRIASRPLHRGNGRPMRREIRELTDDGTPPQVVAVVADADAIDVRDALERTYACGREDRSEDERWQALRDHLTTEVALDTELARAWYGTGSGDEAAARAEVSRRALAKMDELEAGQ